MRKVALAAAGLLAVVAEPVIARGVSPYLPLNLDPEIEQQIERILILADKPVLTRPIAMATVLDALPKACRNDPVSCDDVRRYLARYMRNWGLTEASIEGATSSGAERTLPNRYGLGTQSEWALSAQGFWQPNDHALVSLGVVAYDDEVLPEGTLLSIGFDRAQLDIGYRPHWLSPLTDSSMLISTHAPSMPSITVSNYVPLTRFGIQYEAFVASMSKSDEIAFKGELQEGNPRLAGVHLSIEPASGWAVGANRLLQYGGASRPGGVGDLLRAFFDPSRYDNTDPTTSDQQFGNQLASVTSTFLFPGKVPFAVYFEHAGEDTSNGKNFLLGNAALSIGIRFPRLWRRFDLTYEASEWQNAWYVNSLYGDGLTNRGHVIGHWGGEERVRQDAVGAQTHMVRVGWQPPFGGHVDLRLSTLENASYSLIPYQREYDATLRYSRTVHAFSIGAEVFAGRNVFGEHFSRVGAFFRYAGESAPVPGSALDDELENPTDKSAVVFVEAGASSNSVHIDLDPAVSVFTRSNVGAHVAIGARRAVSDRSDLGARLELDDVDGSTLASVRLIDYRYRFANPLAVSAFVGASRYDLATPAYGLYFGVGAQWRDVLPGWDVGVDARTALKVARDHLLPGDSTNPVRPDSFYTVRAYSLSLSKNF